MPLWPFDAEPPPPNSSFKDEPWSDDFNRRWESWSTERRETFKRVAGVQLEKVVPGEGARILVAIKGAARLFQRGLGQHRGLVGLDGEYLAFALDLQPYGAIALEQYPAGQNVRPDGQVEPMAGHLDVCQRGAHAHALDVV